MGKPGNVEPEFYLHSPNLGGNVEFMGRKLKCQLLVMCLKGFTEHKCYQRSEETMVASRWHGQGKCHRKGKT